MRAGGLRSSLSVPASGSSRRRVSARGASTRRGRCCCKTVRCPLGQPRAALLLLSELAVSSVLFDNDRAGF